MQHQTPNIIFILSDQHNGEIMANLGDPYVRTPNMDRLANNGTNYTRTYCNSPICVPSRSSLLTSKLPSQNHVYNNMQSLSSSDITLAHCLGAVGYETALVGRMHFTGPDQNHGYLRRFVGDLTPTTIGFDNEAELYGDLMRTSNQSPISLHKSGWGNSAVLEYDNAVTKSACEYLDQYNTEKPLFLTVGYYGPHCPYVANKELFNYYYNLLPELEDTREIQKNIHPAIQEWYKNRDLYDYFDKDEVRRVRAAYYAMVEIMDRHLGTLLDKIEETVGLDNSIIIYASDHGDTIGEKGLYWKSTFYEGSVRVPMIFSWKDHIKSGHIETAAVSLLDLAPTLTDFANAPGLPGALGQSLKQNLLDGTPINKERVILSQLADIKGELPSAMVVKGQYKLIKYAGYETCQLFDLAKDPQENNNLAQKQEYFPLIKELIKYIEQFWNEEEQIKAHSEALASFSIHKQFVYHNGADKKWEWYGKRDENYVYRN